MEKRKWLEQTWVKSKMQRLPLANDCTNRHVCTQADLNCFDVLARNIGYVQQPTDSRVVDANKDTKRLYPPHSPCDQRPDLRNQNASNIYWGNATHPGSRNQRPSTINSQCHSSFATGRLRTSKCRKSSFSLAFTTEHTTFRLARVTSNTAKLTSCPAKCVTISCRSRVITSRERRLAVLTQSNCTPPSTPLPAQSTTRSLPSSPVAKPAQTGRGR